MIASKILHICWQIFSYQNERIKVESVKQAAFLLRSSRQYWVEPYLSQNSYVMYTCISMLYICTYIYTFLSHLISSSKSSSSRNMPCAIILQQVPSSNCWQWSLSCTNDGMITANQYWNILWHYQQHKNSFHFLTQEE